MDPDPRTEPFEVPVPRAAVSGCGRIEEIARFVPAGARVVDVGTDHGALPVALLARGGDPVGRCIASDLKDRPLRGARDALAALVARRPDLAGRFDVRLGDGLATVAPGEVDVVCIAGMGSNRMVPILGAGRAVLEAGVRRLVLQPFAGLPTVRRFVADGLGWVLEAERCAVRRGRLQFTLVAAPPSSAAGPAPDFDGAPARAVEVCGPWLLTDPACRDLVVRDLRRRIAEMRAGPVERAAFAARIRELEEIADWAEGDG